MEKLKIIYHELDGDRITTHPLYNHPFIEKKDDCITVIFKKDAENYLLDEIKKLIISNNFSNNEKLFFLDFCLDYLVDKNKIKVNDLADGILSFTQDEKIKKNFKNDFQWVINWSIQKDLIKFYPYIYNVLDFLSIEQIKACSFQKNQSHEMMNYVFNKKVDDDKILAIILKTNFSITQISNLSPSKKVIEIILDNLNLFPDFSINKEEQIIESEHKNTDSYMFRYNNNNIYGRSYTIEKTYNIKSQSILALAQHKKNHNLYDIYQKNPTILENINYDDLLLEVGKINNNLFYARNFIALLKIFPEKRLTSDDFLNLVSEEKNSKSRTSCIYEHLMNFYFSEKRILEAQTCFSVLVEHVYKRSSGVSAIEDWLKLQNVNLSEKKLKSNIL